MPSPPTVEVSRAAVLAFRLRRHSLVGEDGGAPTQSSIAGLPLLDYGVQDTGTDGAAWALAIRGVPIGSALDRGSRSELVLAWTLRGAPHVYRRADIAPIATATAPLSEIDAASRVFDASKPLKAAGIPILEALRTVAGLSREFAATPRSKGELSAWLTERLPPPYLRQCRPCQAIHAYENTFRLAALQAGLELEPGTSPPVLRRISRLRAPIYRHLGTDAAPQFNVVQNYLRFYGPARVADAAVFLDGAVREVQAHWPSPVVPVIIASEPSRRAKPRSILAQDLDALRAAAERPVSGVQLLGAYDPYLQARDRELLVDTDAKRKELWPVLGRPGAMVHANEICGTWRATTKGRRLAVTFRPWIRLPPAARIMAEGEAERLAEHRTLTSATIEWIDG